MYDGGSVFAKNKIELLICYIYTYNERNEY